MRLQVRLLFEWRDMWVGLYIKEPYQEGPDTVWKVFLIIVPMLPLVVEFRRTVLR